MVSITHINIKELFGIYSYSIPTPDIDISKLLILYGNNGVGKTTIIKMLFYLLSSHDNKGHKSELANIPFKEISVTLSNQQIVSAERKIAKTGEYTLKIINKDNKQLLTEKMEAELENNHYVIRSQKTRKFVEYFKKLDVAIHFISDDRKINNSLSLLRNEDSDQLQLTNLPTNILHKMQLGININETFSLNEIMLKNAISNTEEWFKEQTYIANTIGQDSLNSIYFDIVDKLLDDEDTTKVQDKNFTNKKEILRTITMLIERNKEFIKYKLTKDFNLNKFISIIDKASKEKITLIQDIINPYVKGIEEKLNAIEVTKNIINIFITTLNEFYVDKQVEFDMQEGLRIKSLYNEKETLDPQMLSSGERQLLLLFCNVITARNKASIFIIDEPELSLNVKWQRKLIESLLKCAENSHIQFIFASHSIELLTQYKNQVTNLNDQVII